MDYCKTEDIVCDMSHEPGGAALRKRQQRSRQRARGSSVIEIPLPAIQQTVISELATALGSNRTAAVALLMECSTAKFAPIFVNVLRQIGDNHRVLAAYLEHGHHLPPVGDFRFETRAGIVLSRDVLERVIRNLKTALKWMSERGVPEQKALDLAWPQKFRGIKLPIGVT